MVKYGLTKYNIHSEAHNDTIEAVKTKSQTDQNAPIDEERVSTILTERQEKIEQNVKRRVENVEANFHGNLDALEPEASNKRERNEVIINGSSNSMINSSINQDKSQQSFNLNAITSKMEINHKGDHGDHPMTFTRIENSKNETQNQESANIVDSSGSPKDTFTTDLAGHNLGISNASQYQVPDIC